MKPRVRNSIILCLVSIACICVLIFYIPKPVIDNSEILTIKDKNKALNKINDSLKEKIASLNFRISEIENRRSRSVDSIKLVPVIKKVYLFKQQYGIDSNGLAKAYEEIEICKTDLGACSSTVMVLKDIVSSGNEIIKNQRTIIANDSITDELRVTQLSLKETEIDHLTKKSKVQKAVWQITSGLLSGLSAFLLIAH